jgi:hypothetical protein
MSDTRWEVTIERSGEWPTPWRWAVWRKGTGPYGLRMGRAITKDRARRKAIKARLSMERDDVTVVS